MTGPEHYQAAERLISAARSPKGRAEEDATTLLAALVHATLGLAAAYAEVNPTSAWHKAAGTVKP